MVFRYIGNIHKHWPRPQSQSSHVPWVSTSTPQDQCKDRRRGCNPSDPLGDRLGKVGRIPMWPQDSEPLGPLQLPASQGQVTLRAKAHLTQPFSTAGRCSTLPGDIRHPISSGSGCPCQDGKSYVPEEDRMPVPSLPPASGSALPRQHPEARCSCLSLVNTCSFVHPAFLPAAGAGNPPRPTPGADLCSRSKGGRQAGLSRVGVILRGIVPAQISLGLSSCPGEAAPEAQNIEEDAESEVPSPLCSQDPIPAPPPPRL